MADQKSKRIIGRFLAQVWVGRNQEWAETAFEQPFDATRHILLMNAEEIASLEDRRESTDEIGQTLVNYRSGPCEVDIEDSIAEFFGVESVRDVTDELLENARQDHKALLDEEPVRWVNLTMCFTIPSHEADWIQSEVDQALDRLVQIGDSGRQQLSRTVEVGELGRDDHGNFITPDFD